MELTPTNVRKVLLECLYKPEELTTVDGVNQIPDGAILIEGIMMSLGFHPGRIESNKSDIKAMLEQLPENFLKKPNGGWAFQNACVNRKGELWTGEHRIMDELFMLGQAAGYVKYLMPREDWQYFGGLPYLAIEFLEEANGSDMAENPDMGDAN